MQNDTGHHVKKLEIVFENWDSYKTVEASIDRLRKLSEIFSSIEFLFGYYFKQETGKPLNLEQLDSEVYQFNYYPFKEEEGIPDFSAKHLEDIIDQIWYMCDRYKCVGRMGWLHLVIKKFQENNK